MVAIQQVKFGPFRGYQSSTEAVMAPPDFIVGSTTGSGGSRDVLMDPASGMWFRRKGCAVRGDTVSGGLEVNGLLESGMKWGASPRRLFSLASKSLVSNKSTYAILYGHDTNAATFPTADTGFFGTLYVRNSYTSTDPQTPSGENYNLLAEFGSSHYPTNTGTFVPSSSGLLVCPPLWYESAEGGYMRGAFRYSRQFLCAGSRDSVIAGNWVSFPCLRATPLRWDATFNNVTGAATTNTCRYFPTGPFAPLPSVSITTQTAATGNDAAWTDGDTFYYSVVYRFDDGSYSAPLIPRPTNANLAGGLCLRVVGTIGNTAKYRSIRWDNIPVGPSGAVARILLRTPKQARTAATDVITISPLDLRVVGILTNNTQTSFTDSVGSDVGLVENDNVVRFDLVCPRRARHLWTGDQRVLSGVSLPSPHGIMLAPTGTAASGDLADEADDSVNAQGTTGYVYRITTTGLDLYQYTASTTLGAAVTIDWATYPTVQDVVDKINATTTASTCKEWRASICPGVDASSASANLLPSTWNITNCTTGGGSSTTLTTSGSFANVPIGYYISGTGVTTGTYIVSKASNTSLTMSAAMTVAAATTLDFSAATGDGTGAANYWSGSIVGLMRAFCPAYPGFVYMKRSSLVGYDKIDKQKTFFTVGSPGAALSGSSLAINAWAADNFRLPSISNPGSILGGVDVEGAAVVAYSNGVGLFTNKRGANTGEDFDYKIFTINQRRGPVAWSALTGGNGWAAYTTRDGVFATDKNLREFSIGGAIFNPARGIGDLAYDINNSLSNTDSDADLATIYMGVLRSKLAISYQDINGNRNLIFYDFSPGLEASGVEELANPDSRQPYGWSAPCIYNSGVNAGLTVMGAAASSSGLSFYVCQPDNNSATADGRVDEIDTGDKDNGDTQFHGLAYMPQFISSDFTWMSPQRLQILHRKPNGTTLTKLKVSRDQTFAASNSYTLSSTGSDQFAYEIVQLKSNPDRGPTTMIWLLWDDSEATQGNGFWSVAVQYQQLPN